MQNGAANELHVVVPLAEGTASRFADHGECLREKVIQRCAVIKPAAELVGPCAELFVG